MPAGGESAPADQTEGKTQYTNYSILPLSLSQAISPVKICSIF